ncbi:DUF3883 domain-containing protein [Bacillus sp. MRMR6]|uniref:DUF3883 domain-containing protein n=1 Tax=Bacillus sp. MRMR6 TaxID=1928617 RepID=UPI000952918A|nr:DUF3883 domain-containing protein [Bacillus sp. MRMR6]OLS40831.1 hypothetical protein BTR25_08060 [Bacillus sp. MRMR6]
MKIFKEINWGLQEVRRYKSKYGSDIREPYLDKVLKDSLIFSNNNIISNMLKYHFIIIDNGKVALTETGEQMTKYTNDKYELSDKQKGLVTGIYIQVNTNLAKQWFSLFVNTEKCIERSTIEKSMLQYTEDMISLEIAIQENDLIFINKDYYQLVDLHIRKGITEAELFTILENNKKLGDLAEQIALGYEKNRFNQMCENLLAEKVQLISKSNVSAGYDIISFKDTKSQTHDAFIEVKYFNNNHFYLSQNEYKTAELLKEDYYLYLVNTDSKAIKIIRDPFKNLENLAKSIEVVCTKYTL